MTQAHTSEPQPSTTAIYQELLEAATNSAIGMRISDAESAYFAAREHLGRDNLVTQRNAEFAALPEATRKEMQTTKNFGEYGIFHLFGPASREGNCSPHRASP